MKKILLTALMGILLGGFTNVINAQVTEKVMQMSEGSKNAISFFFEDVDEKTIEKVWVDFTKKNFKVKAKKNKSKEYFCDDAEIKYFDTDNTVDVYATVEKGTAGTTLTVWYDLGGAYLSSDDHPEDYVEAEKIMYKVALDVKVVQTEEELKEQEKILKKLENEKKKLEKDKEGYEGDIEMYNKKIEERVQDIEENVQDQANKDAEIDTQKDVVKEVEKRLDKLNK